MKKIAYSELIFLGKPVLQNVQALMEAGSKNVELMMDGDGWNDEGGLLNTLLEELPKIGAAFSAHPPAWDINLTSPIKALRDAALQVHKASILFAHKMGAKQVVLHPGYCNYYAFSKKNAHIWARDATEELISFCKPLGVKLAYENVGYHGSSIYTFDEYCHALDDVDETVGYLIDTGHANANGWDVPALIDKLSERLFAMHLHDNHGDADSHLPIGEGNLNWPAIFASMRTIKGDCDLILEYAPGTAPQSLREGAALLAQELG
jgi:sugar phosphate isomerase/epimerase